MFAEGTLAVRDVELTKVVARAIPFHWTNEPETKFDPATVKVKAGPSAIAEFGLSEAIAGIGLLIVKVRALEVPPPGVGLKTVIEAVPVAAMLAEGTVADKFVELTNVVASGAPFHIT